MYMALLCMSHWRVCMYEVVHTWKEALRFEGFYFNFIFKFKLNLKWLSYLQQLFDCPHVSVGKSYSVIPITPRKVRHHTFSKISRQILPQAGRPPALPVFLESGWPPLPRSSVPACTTTVRYSEHLLAQSNRKGFVKWTYANNTLRSN
jgi:hypothetical protein